VDRELKRVNFGSVGHDYVERYLDSNRRFGKQLGRLLQDRLGTGVVWGWVPTDVPGERVMRLGGGGVFPGSVPEWESRMLGWLVEQLTEGQMFCCEGAMELPSDGFLASPSHPDLPVFFSGDSVFFYEEAGATQEQVSRWLIGDVRLPDIAVVCAAPGGSPPAKWETVDVSVVESIAESASVVVLGAWDGEGHVYWEPD
jgi:hypothetical protein